MTVAAHRRVLSVLLAVLGGVLVVATAWVVVTGLLARDRLEGVRSDLSAYRSALLEGDTTKAEAVGRRIQQRAGSAHQLTSGPAWWVGSHILGVGTPLRTARAVSYATDRLADEALPGLPDLLGTDTGTTTSTGTGAGTGTKSGTGSSSPGRVDVAGLGAAAAQLDRVRILVGEAGAVVRASPASWLGPASGGRRSALAKLTELDGDLGTAVRATRTLAPMLGADRPQRYFVGFLNEAESRSIGGLPGAFAIVTVDDGQISVEHIGSDTELAGVRAHVDLGAEYNNIYARDDPTGVIQNSDIGPSFPDAARIWAGMWQAKTGEHVDGAIAVDPSALGYLLSATGPVRLPDGTTVSAANIANLTQAKQYRLYPGFDVAQKVKRTQFLASIARAVSTELLRTSPVTELLSPLRQAVHERRVVVWTADASREHVIVGAGLGGVLSPGRAPFSSFFINNAAGGKLDFYLHRTMTYRATGCGADRTATASLTLDNDTPDYHLPPYVTYVSGGRPKGAAPGYNRLIVSYYATPGSAVRSVSLDGTAQHLTSTTEDGLTSVRLIVGLPAGARRTLTVVTDEPATTGTVQIVAQPLVYALRVHATQSPCTADPVTAAPANGFRVGAGTVVAVVLGALLLLAAGVVAWCSRRHGAESRAADPVTRDPATGTSDP